MKVLRALALIATLGCIFATAVLAHYALQHPWMWILVITHLITSYAGCEITHSMFKKPTMPHPASLAFQKEVMGRYKEI